MSYQVKAQVFDLGDGKTHKGYLLSGMSFDPQTDPDIGDIVDIMPSKKSEFKKGRNFLVVYRSNITKRDEWRLVTRELADERHARKMKKKYDDAKVETRLIDLTEQLK